MRGWRQDATVAGTVLAHLAALNADGLALDTLSMGMSADLDAAVMEGATLVRVGSAVFGERDSKAAAGG